MDTLQPELYSISTNTDTSVIDRLAYADMVIYKLYTPDRSVVGLQHRCHNDLSRCTRIACIGIWYGKTTNVDSIPETIRLALRLVLQVVEAG